MRLDSFQSQKRYIQVRANGCLWKTLTICFLWRNEKELHALKFSYAPESAVNMNYSFEDFSFLLSHKYKLQNVKQYI